MKLKPTAAKITGKLKMTPIMAKIGAALTKNSFSPSGRVMGLLSTKYSCKND